MIPWVQTALRRVNRLSPEAAFAWIAGVFGVLMVFVTPPLQVPDEPNHWYRVYRVYEGHVVDVRAIGPDRYEYGGAVPASLFACSDKFERMTYDPRRLVPIASIVAELKRPLQADVTVDRSVPNTALYSPVPYVPAVVAVGVTRLLGLSPLLILYAGRLATLAGYVAVGWLAIRTTPMLKWPAALILGGPMGLFLGASVSADPMTTALAFLATASILAHCTVDAPADATPIAPPVRRRWSDLPLWPSLIGLALCKSAYVPLGLIALAIPARTWRRRVGIAAVLVATISVAAAWSAVTHPTFVHEAGDDPRVQLAWVRGHPAEYLAVCWNTTRDQWFAYVWSAVGNLGWLDTPMPVQFIVLYPILIVYLAVACGEPVRLRWPARVLAAIAVVASTFLITLAIYAVWNKTAAPMIIGIQGRYFLPLTLAGLAVIRRGNGLKVPTGAMLAIQAFTASYTIITIVGRYYVPALRQGWP